LPEKFGRYRIIRELGQGQMGTVYLANDVELDRSVALKVARLSNAGSAKMLKRMEIEAKAAAKVDHPLICKVYDAGEIDGIRFIALQYVEGEDLKKYLAQKGRRLEPPEAVRLIQLIAQALAAAHEKGVMHRDLKPENVMINKRQEPVIMDFGLARQTVASPNAGLTQGMIVGTAAYMSPEQATGRAEAIDHRSDIYAVGVMLFEMLTGEWPFSGGSIEVMGKKCVQEAPSPIDVNAIVHPQLAEVCRKMIARKKEDRYATFADVERALNAIDLNAPATATDPGFSFDAALDLDEFPPLPIAMPRRKKVAEPPKRKPAGSAKSRRPSGGVATPTSNHRTILAAAGIGSAVSVALVVLVVVVFRQMRLAQTHVATTSDAAQSSEATNQQTVRHEEKAPERAPRDELVSRAQASQPSETQSQASTSAKAPAAELPHQEAIAKSDRGKGDASTMEENPEQDSRTEPGALPATSARTVAAEPASSDATSADLDAVIASAALFVKARDGKQAITVLKKASREFKNEIRPDFYLGLLHSGVGVNDPKTAEVHFKKALDRSPEHIPTLNNLGLTQMKAHKFGAAASYFASAAKNEPRPIEVNQNLGRMVAQAVPLNIKKDELRKIVALHTSPGSFQPQKGWMYMPIDTSPKMLAEYKSFCIDGRLDDRSCSFCTGLGGVRCKGCGGRGTVLATGTDVRTVQTNNGPATVSTPTSAEVRCTVCNGTGKLDCPRCNDGHDPSLR
jgi:serine/threonine protein kinase